eukprot:10437624-Prorocentrum_lima.AAC.1
MLNKYWREVGGRLRAGATGPSAVRFNFLEFKEQIQAMSGIDRTIRGEFMWKKELFEFRMSVKGGRFSEQEVAAEWSSYLKRRQE